MRSHVLVRNFDVVLRTAETISATCEVYVVPTQDGKKWWSQELQEVPNEGKRGEGTWIKLSGEVEFNRTKLHWCWLQSNRHPAIRGLLYPPLC
jgi:hypothetical protein